MICTAFATQAFPQSGQPSEYGLKAAFLFNFAKFIDWPDKTFGNGHSNFTICVMGQNPFGHALDDSLLGKSVGTHPVETSYLPSVNNLGEARRCQIIFISASEKNHFREVITSLNGTSALLVGDTTGFAASGGAIEFMVEDDHIHFQINPDATDHANLKVSSKLLALAKIVHDGENYGKS